MNYKELISRISKNINVQTVSSNDIATIKEDVEDILLEAYATAEAPKVKRDFDLPSDSTSQQMPDNMFIPFEVIFKQGDTKLLSKEMTIEEYEQWQNTTLADSIRTDEGVAKVIATEENKYYDGKVGFYFTHEDEKTILNWKPALSSAKVTVVYSSVPTTASFVERDIIKIHRVYMDLLVLGATAREYRRRLGSSKDEVALLRNKTAYAEYHNLYKLKLNDFAGFMNKETEPRNVLPFDWLNDPNMLL